MSLVTFVVTSFNYANFIEQTIESLKKQNYNDIEIIVVDDFSSDNSVEILEKIDGIRLIQHKKNKGQLAAILTGLELARGEFISFIDSDDVLFENYAKTLVNELIQTNISFVSSNAMESKIISTKEAVFGGWWWSPMSSAMFKKDSIEILKYFKNSDNWKICPDKFLFNFANLVGNSALTSEKLFKKRIHNMNAGSRPNRFWINLKNNLIIRKNIVDFINQNKVYFIDKYGIKKVNEMMLTINSSYTHIFTQCLDKVHKFSY